MEFQGRAHLLGDDINTDYIISSRRKRDTIDPDILKQYFMEDVDPALAARIRGGDILVAGKNFGCGSAMEVAATTIKALGINTIIAQSFSRSFFRNGINNGLALIELDTSEIHDGDKIKISFGDKQTTVEINDRNINYSIKPLPLIMQEILMKGGITPYFVENNGKFKF